MTEADGEVVALAEATSPGLPPGISEAEAAQMARAAERARASRRHFSSLSRRDKVVLWIIVGVPTAIHVVFVWIPAISTIVLSFTNWNGIVGVGDIRFVGFRNYWEIFTVFEKDFWSAAINNGFLVVFLFLVPDGASVSCSPTCSTRTCAAAPCTRASTTRRSCSRSPSSGSSGRA